MDDSTHSISPHHINAQGVWRYHIENGAKAADYVGVFMAAINWPAVRHAYDGVRP